MGAGHRNLIAIVLPLAWCVTPVGPVQAEPVHAESFEWVLADSDAVVRGTILDVVTTPGIVPARAPEDVKRDGVGWCHLTLRVARTLKGPKLHTVTFLAWDWGRDRGSRLADKKGRELLFCLVRSERYFQ